MGAEHIFYASVQAFCERAKTELPRLDVVIANAGLTTRKFRITEDNEETITTNVVSTALLACLLHPKLRETPRQHNPDTYFTVTGSELYEMAKFEERKVPAGKLFAALNSENKSQMPDRYNVSKLVVTFFVKQLVAMAPVEDGRGG